ncbi:MAG: DegT/DnrJ/EryC1/StrS family aminotransferase [Myxococcales bacterium]
MILCSNPKAQYLAHQADIDAAIQRVLASGYYVLGTEVKAFESEFAAYATSKHCVGVGSGTEALHVAIRALGIGPGDEVITTAHTAVATVSAIELAGATPVFADIDPKYFTLDPALVERAISPATKAIIAVHLYGQPVDLTAFSELARRRGLKLIEDCAQAHGALHQGRKVGSVGDIAAFSCYPTKNLGAIGDGGMIVTNDDALATRCRLLREYGWAERYVSHISGFNSRLDELQAAILRVKLPALDADNQKRRDIAARYDAELRGLPIELPSRRPETEHVFHLYVLRAKNRDRLQEHLKAAGVGALIHYPVPIHLQKAYLGKVRGGESLPETERAAREVLSLPMYPELSEAEVGSVIQALRSFAWP